MYLTDNFCTSSKSSFLRFSVKLFLSAAISSFMAATFEGFRNMSTRGSFDAEAIEVVEVLSAPMDVAVWSGGKRVQRGK